MPSRTKDQKLVIIGGAEDRDAECAILRRFVELAGGPRARIVVTPVASEIAEKVAPEYVALFRRLGAGEVSAEQFESRAEAADPAKVERLARATGVFFTGGDQSRIVSVLGGTEVDTTLHRRWEQGMVLSGTSAGATAMSSTMLMDDSPTDRPLEETRVSTGPGMEFLPGVIIDQHFGERKRLGRLLSVVARYPHELGIGIDENTGLVVEGSEFEVIGAGSVTIIDAGGAVFERARVDAARGKLSALYDIKLHVLCCGSKFDLLARKPLLLKNGANGDAHVNTSDRELR
jgi:cyanophycinase